MEENREKNADENTYKNRAYSRHCWKEGGEREIVNVIFFVVMPRIENVWLCYTSCHVECLFITLFEYNKN